MSEDGSQIADCLDGVSAWAANACNAYGWVVPALLFTICFFAFIVFISWVSEDIPVEFDIFGVPGAIFRWSRKRWGPSH
jgi:hypothetical protein